MIADQISPLTQLPPPATIHRRIGDLHRELTLLRKLMRLALSVHEERHHFRDAEQSGVEQQGAPR